MNRYALVIDHDLCWGCRACEVACKQENRVPPGIRWISLEEDGPQAVDGALEFRYRVKVCRHCEDPECLPVCPAEAITRREDGIIVLNEDLCTGCRLCLEACPYGAVSFNELQGTASKCNLCRHRVDQGLYPACADNICLAHGIYFGDPVEIDAVIREKAMRRKGENR